jgi:5-methyltetrahydrofolate--homocysteine methyltransferase
VPIEEARKRRAPITFNTETIATPTFTGVRVLDDFPLEVLRNYIDWTPFFHTWELKGVYPRIFENKDYGDQARQLFEDANALLDQIIAGKQIQARAVYGLFPANAVGDDVELYTEETRTEVRETFHFLRQQANREGSEPCRSLADFIAPKETGLPDYIGAFAVTTGHGIEALRNSYRAKNDDYNAIMAEALADRLAEAFAECLHKRVREEWGYEKTEMEEYALSHRTTTQTTGALTHGSQHIPSKPGFVSGHDYLAGASISRADSEPHKVGPSGPVNLQDLIDEKYRGIRPAPGYPACPDHTEKGILWHLLDVENNAGMRLTESFAMWPGSSVSGLYFAHPDSRYFTLGKIDRDQLSEYAVRKGLSVDEAERWMGPNLNQ